MNVFRDIPVKQAIEYLRQGDLLVAGSAHLAAQWRQRFVEAHSGVVETPAIHTWQAWLDALALRFPDVPVALSALQELQLWEQIIRADASLRGEQASARGLARHAAKAYGLLCEYRIEPEELVGGGDEAEALASWIVTMRHTATRYKRVLAADLPALLLPRIASAAKVDRLMLDGLDYLTPMQQSLLQALHEQGTTITSVDPETEPAGMTVIACSDGETEYRHVARRIAACVEADPHARVAVVTSRQVRDIETLRRILDDTLLSPAERLPAMQASMHAVAMPGLSLARIPIISHLLRLLRLAGRRGATHADLAPLLFAPGIRGYEEERGARAALDAGLRARNRHYISFDALRAMEEAEEIPQFIGVLEMLAGWETTARMAGDWVKATHGLLQSAGFLQADSAGRSDSEVRQLNAFRDCLASLVAMDAIAGTMAWDPFLSLLVSVCNDTPLSEPVRFPQVSVLPLTQVAGLRFDTVFAVGFDEEALPLPAEPVPLLPFSLQHRYGLPGATARQAFTDSERLWRRLRQAAPVVHVSFARSRESRELNPSPLLAGIDIGMPDPISDARDMLDTEPFQDAPAVPLTAEEKVGGGAAMIRYQSACPFRAFASHRLRLAPLGETVPGVTPADKGSLIHHALEYIWGQLGSQHALLALDEMAVAELINAAMTHAWRQSRIAAPGTMQQFERRRMASVLGEWLEVERQRPAFAVEQCEKPYRLMLPTSGVSQFPVVLKADRIDRDDAGHRILIDYKTGQRQSISKWIGERIAEPQLPLYAVAEGLGSGDAVCFARVRSGDTGFEGLSGETTDIRGINPYKGEDESAEDWSSLLARWRERIDALAAEFVQGRCDVSPRDAHACDYCGLEAVCRIDEIGIDRDTEEETP